jgi:hypothetical protein
LKGGSVFEWDPVARRGYGPPGACGEARVVKGERAGTAASDRFIVTSLMDPSR